MRALRPRLRTVLLTVNLLILLLPLGGIAILRLYENELIRGTEAQLIAQAAWVRELFLDAFQVAWRDQGGDGAPGRPLPEGWVPTHPVEGRLRPIPATLDIARHAVLSPPPEGSAPHTAVDPVASRAGAAINDLLDGASEVTLAAVRVVDANGIVVATSGSEIGLSLADREEVERSLRGQDVSLLRRKIDDQAPPPLASLSRGQRYRIFVALPVILDDRLVGAVVLSRTPLDIAKALYLHRRTLVLGAAGLLGVVVVVSVLTSLTISRPVRALIRQTDAVTRGERREFRPMGAPATHELARLSEAVAEMARTLEQRADYIRTFASHVSHEFKTPLTSLRGSIELLQDHFDTMTGDERRRFLNNLDAAAERLEQLVRRLLDLARADALTPGAEASDVTRVIDEVLEHRGAQGPEVTTRSDPRVGEARIGAEMLAEVLNQLLDNAQQHGGDGVRARIETRLIEAGGGRVEIRIEDDGEGISEANATRVFTPFFTTARDRGGTGLGLSIVRALAEAHGASIRLAPSQRGACFVLELTAASREGSVGNAPRSRAGSDR